MPLYFQVATEIEEKIAAGTFPVDSFLPSELALAKQFGVSLITVRSAMRVLLDAGLVVRKAGKGTVVAGSTPSAVWELGWLNDLVTSVMPSQLCIVSMGKWTPPAWAVSRLNCLPERPIHGMITVRQAIQRGAEPFMTTELYHPADIGSALKRRDFESPATNAKLVILTVEKRCDLKVVSVRQTMTAEIADKAVSKLLQVKPGVPLLVVNRDYFDATGRLVQAGRTRYRTDHYAYTLRLSRAGARSGRLGLQEEGRSSGSD